VVWSALGSPALKLGEGPPPELQDALKIPDAGGSRSSIVMILALLTCVYRLPHTSPISARTICASSVTSASRDVHVEALPAQILDHLLDEVVAIDQKHRGAGLDETPHDGPKTPGRVAIFHASLVPCAGTMVSAISLMS
jgi:hypothetical protein